MDQAKEHATVSCSQRCSECWAAETADAQGEHALRGWRLGLSAAAAFLLPLCMAIVGTIVGAKTGMGQVLGALAFLAAGLVASVPVARLLRRAGKEVA